MSVCLTQPGCVSAMERRQITYETVQQEARGLAREPYRKPEAYLPEDIRNLDYDQYQHIQFRPDKALWLAEQLPFQAQFFHRGYLFTDPVMINEFTETHVQEIPYVEDFFRFGDLQLDELPRRGSGYAGWKLLSRINAPKYFDEVIVFLGASYFRSLGKDQVYGISARGLQIPFGPDEAEEFPAFTRFWLRKPDPASDSFLCYALLDSPSVSGAYRFRVTPGAPTRIEVEATLYPRRELPSIGLGGLTSMFYYGENTFPKANDFRPEVHDSDGLLLEYGPGDRRWRPLDVAAQERLSYFNGTGLTAFGLHQRDRDFDHYLDGESQYHRRPSVRVILDTGFDSGHVILREIPPDKDFFDNVVAGYFPNVPLVPGQAYRFKYRMEWGNFSPPEGMAVIRATRHGKDIHKEDIEIFHIEYQLPEGIAPAGLELKASASANARLERQWVDPASGQPLVRVYLQVAPVSSGPVELSAQLLVDGAPVSEQWLYQWSPSN